MEKVGIKKVFPKYKVVTERLRSDIIGGRYKSEQALPSHQRLMEKFGVSLSTVRHSVKQLESEGLVRLEHGRGVFVSNRFSTGKVAIVMQSIGWQSRARHFTVWHVPF